METKRLVILANSIRKKPSRCVAGREIVRGGGRYAFGQWIRPISLRGQEGELSVPEITLTNGQMVSVLDFVDMPLVEPQGHVCQPENWIIQGGGNWVSLNQQYRRPLLHLLEEHPDGLWLDKPRPNDRVLHEKLAKNPPAQSIYCVRAEGARLTFGTNERGKPARRAIFSYGGERYDLACTDPLLGEKYCPIVPAAGEPVKVVELGNALVCVSLAREYEGFHFKIAATIFEPNG